MVESSIRKIPILQLTDLICDEIVRYIKDNRLRPGDRLPTENQLCESLGVSRTVLRESLMRLEDRGLVEAIPGRGRFVTSPDFSSISRNISSLLLIDECSLDDVMEIRRVVEVSLAGFAAVKASDEQLRVVEEAHQDIKRAGEDLARALSASMEFHIAIANAGGNHLGEILVAATMQLTSELRHSTWALDVDHFQLHKETFDALKRRDPIAARKAMSDHFDTTYRLIKQAKRLEE